MKLKAFFCHPFNCNENEMVCLIKNILKERKVKVEEIQPIKNYSDIHFSEEFDINELNKRQQEIEYNISRKGQRDKWIEWMNKIKECNLFIVWIPRGEDIRNCYALLQYALMWQKERRSINRRIRERTGINFDRKDKPYLIQIITKIWVPLIAYAVDYGNQLFKSVEDFERLRISRWD